jgi:hypothetical protein
VAVLVSAAFVMVANALLGGRRKTRT